MWERFKNKISGRSAKANSTRGTLMFLIGVYVCYLGITMPRDVESGVSSMSKGLSVFWMVIMLIAGVFAAAYGALVFYFGWKEQKAIDDEARKQRLSENANIMSNEEKR